MLGITKVFRSRWRALFWSAGIVWLAVEVASTASAPPAGSTNYAVATAQ